jgi:hypothetical protein
MTVEYLQNESFKQPLKVLFDSGSSRTLIRKSIIPQRVKPHKLSQPALLNTGGGQTRITEGVMLRQIRFPELCPTRSYAAEVEALVSSNTANYDIILGQDVMVAARLTLCCDTQTIRWGDLFVPWKNKEFLQTEGFLQHLSDEVSSLDFEVSESFTTQLSTREILSSKYQETDTREVAQAQVHLTQRQREELATLLQNFTTLFSGKLGCYPHQKVHLELNDKATPSHFRPYPVPHAHLKVFKEELDRLEELGVLSRIGPAKYLSPTFIIPKKDGTVRWVSDFRKLNSMITRKVYHLPRIQDILRKRSRYVYFTKLDISMQYYTFELDEEAKELCAICTPFGNYQLNDLGYSMSSHVKLNFIGVTLKL